jgi:FSR family fosmidomycin resistance protein-like MFS transporter
MAATAELGSAPQDAKILGLISTGHFMSHFYFLTLPPLFPFLKDAFNVSYTELGAMITVLYGTAAITQVPVGFMVDRYGARMVLTVGLIMLAVGFGLVGLAPSFPAVLALAVIAGAGNSVFHPADYAILAASISPQRMGRAFSIHTFAGHLGSAAAPATMIFLAAMFGWRTALVSVGIFGLIVVLALSTQWNSLRDDALPRKKGKQGDEASAAQPSGWSLLFSKPMVLFFLFFATLSMTSSGMQAFSVSALVALHDMPLATASLALTVYLFCNAAGILVGGHISDRTARHDVVAGIVFVLTVIITLIFAWVNLPLAVLVVLMVVLGLGQGIIRPARDMMLRAASPKGSVGKVFGFVSAGIAVGSAIAPIPFGLILDAGRPEWVFYLMAIFMAVALFTVAVPKQMTPKAGPEAAPQGAK